MRIFMKICILTCTLLCMTACGKKDDEVVQLKDAEAYTSSEAKEDKSEKIFVYVCGAVQSEGVYELPKGSRVFEAINAAGGFREDAATIEVNQAEILEDEMTVYVPTQTEVLEQTSKTGGKININKATKDELMTLPGIGESRAESIIQYREEHGKFKSIEEIMQISGIKEALFENIKDLIKI